MPTDRNRDHDEFPDTPRGDRPQEDGPRRERSPRSSTHREHPDEHDLDQLRDDLYEDPWEDGDLDENVPAYPPARTAPECLAGLSLDKLLGGAGAGAYSELYETELLRKLHLEARRLAFLGEDPTLALARLNAHDERATVVFADEPVRFGSGGSCRPFVVETPETFPRRRYVLTYHLPPPEYASRIVGADGAGAIRAWLSEAPLRRARPAGNGPLSGIKDLLSLFGSARDDAPDGAASRWLEAFPGFLGDYETRVTGHWRMQPAGSYLVRMRFHEDLGIMDLCSGGILDLYPFEKSFRPYRSADLHTGDVTLPAVDEASAFVRDVVPALEERGILCDPEIVLKDAYGSGAFEPVDPHAEARLLAELLSGPPYTEPHPEERDLFPPGEWHDHRVLSGISDAVPDQEDADSMLRRTDSFMVALQRSSELRRRLDDPAIPPRRKRDLSEELTKVEEWRERTARGLLESPTALITLLASVERERDVLHDSLRRAYDTLGHDPSVRNHVEGVVRRLDALREGEKTYHG